MFNVCLHEMIGRLKQILSMYTGEGISFDNLIFTSDKVFFYHLQGNRSKSLCVHTRLSMDLYQSYQSLLEQY